MGIGWAVSGFCPGTGLVAVGAQRKDALFFILGGLVGALIFTVIYGSIESAALFEKIGGGKATLAETGIEKYTALLPAIPAVAVAGIIGIVFILIAWKLPQASPRDS